MAIEKINTTNVAPKNTAQNYNESVKKEVAKDEKNLSEIKKIQEQNKGFKIDKKV